MRERDEGRVRDSEQPGLCGRETGEHLATGRPDRGREGDGERERRLNKRGINYGMSIYICTSLSK